MRGVQVGRVGEITGGQGPASLQLEIDPDQIQYIPANVEAQIRATTAFGAKFVDLVYPADPSPQRLAAGAVLRSHERHHRGQHRLRERRRPAGQDRPGQAERGADRGGRRRARPGRADRPGHHRPQSGAAGAQRRSETIREDWRSFKSFNDTYAAAAHDIVTILDAGSTTSTTVADHASALDCAAAQHRRLLELGIGNCSRPARTTWSRAVNLLEPTTNLLLKYNPVYTCLLQGANWTLDTGGATTRGAARTASRPTSTSPCCSGNDPYQYPDNLPIVAAKGGPGGKPGCGSLPDRHQELPGAPAGHQHRLGHRPGHPAQPRHRAPVLGQLLPGHPRGAGAAEHPPVPARAGARTGPVPGHAALRRGLYGPGGVPLWPGCRRRPTQRGATTRSTDGAAPPIGGHRHRARTAANPVIIEYRQEKQS